MTLFHCSKPVVCKVHGFCVAGGTDMALCSDLLVIAADAKIGYPPARVWGSPTTALWASRVGPMRAKRLLLTGDSLSGEQAWAALERFNDAMREVGREKSVAVIDLAHLMPKSSRFYYDFLHFSKAGAAKVADIVAGQMCPILAEKTPGYTTTACSAP